MGNKAAQTSSSNHSTPVSWGSKRLGGVAKASKQQLSEGGVGGRAHLKGLVHHSGPNLQPQGEGAKMADTEVQTGSELVSHRGR